MGLTLPNPTVPANGQALDAGPLKANQDAMAQAIQSFDGAQVQAGTILAAAMASSANPNTLLNATSFPFVSSGLVWSSVSGLNGGMTGGTLYYNGIPVVVNAVASHAFTASKDTYVDIDNNGNITYQAVTTNTTSPSLTANSIRVGIVISSGAALTSFNQGEETKVFPIASSIPYAVTDSIGNLICPRDPQRRLLGYRQILTNFAISSASATLITGLSVPVIVPTGRKIKISLRGDSQKYATATGNSYIGIFDTSVGGTLLASNSVTSSTANAQSATYLESITTPSATSKTYVASLQGDSGAVVSTLVAGANTPAFIKVELM